MSLDDVGGAGGGGAGAMDDVVAMVLLILLTLLLLSCQFESVVIWVDYVNGSLLYVDRGYGDGVVWTFGGLAFSYFFLKTRKRPLLVGAQQ